MIIHPLHRPPCPPILKAISQSLHAIAAWQQSSVLRDWQRAIQQVKTCLLKSVLSARGSFTSVAKTTPSLQVFYLSFAIDRHQNQAMSNSGSSAKASAGGDGSKKDGEGSERSSEPAMLLTSDEVNYLVYRYACQVLVVAV